MIQRSCKVWLRQIVDTKSIGRMGWQKAWLLVVWVPLMHWIEECRREKDQLHLIQAIVLLQGWSHLEDSSKASLLQQTLAAFLRVFETSSERHDKGGKEPCSTSQTVCSQARFLMFLCNRFNQGVHQLFFTMAAQLVPCMVQDYWYLGPCKVEVWCAWAIRDTGTESCTCCNNYRPLYLFYQSK